MSAVQEPSSNSRPSPDREPDPTSFVRVRTTLPRRPMPPISARQPILTERLNVRPLTIDDLPAIYELRTQPEVMHWTAVGLPDKDIDESRAKLELYLPPKDGTSFNFAICFRETGQLIGMGGCHMFRGSFGWPEVGYMIRTEFWGKGLGTEFLRGWLAVWAELEREEVEMDVDGRTVEGEGVKTGEDGGVSEVREQLIAVTAAGNDKSQGVLKKAGFEWFVSWLTQDLHKGAGPDSLVELPTYRSFWGGKKGE